MSILMSDLYFEIKFTKLTKKFNPIEIKYILKIIDEILEHNSHLQYKYFYAILDKLCDPNAISGNIDIHTYKYAIKLWNSNIMTLYINDIQQYPFSLLIDESL
jgi:hypothetical protein